MTTLPKVNFCGHEISRLIVGGNTVSGTSHFSKEMDMAMEDYFTVQHIKDMLFRCQELGITAMQMRGDKHIMRLIREFRREGGTLNWIAQSAPEMGSFDGNVAAMAAYQPALMFHHGCVTDDLYRAGNFEELTRRLGVMRQTGIPVGLCTHIPEVVEYAQTHKWDIDFYMCSVYNVMVPERQKQVREDGNEDALFVESDIAKMYEAVRGADKPCLVFKILGAMRRCGSRESVAHAFKECFSHIKKDDAVVVGMFPRDMDQVAANVAHVIAAVDA